MRRRLLAAALAVLASVAVGGCSTPAAKALPQNNADLIGALAHDAQLDPRADDDGGGGETWYFLTPLPPVTPDDVVEPSIRLAAETDGTGLRVLSASRFKSDDLAAAFADWINSNHPWNLVA